MLSPDDDNVTVPVKWPDGGYKHPLCLYLRVQSVGLEGERHVIVSKLKSTSEVLANRMSSFLFCSNKPSSTAITR